MPLQLSPTFAQVLAAADRPQVGMWVCSGSPLVAEICAGSGLDWLLIDMEHAPNGLESVLAQLHAVAAYPIRPVVRVPVGETVLIKQVLDLGATDILVPMVSSADQAREVVAAAHYPPRGRRGVGSALARSARWNRVDDYLANAAEHVGVHVQVENAEGVAAAAEIAAVDGVDSVFVGPSDLAASLGVLGQQNHPQVVAAVQQTFDAVRAAGKPVGVNAFDPQQAKAYLDGRRDSGAAAKNTRDSGAPAKHTRDSGAPAKHTRDSGAPAKHTRDSGAAAKDARDSAAAPGQGVDFILVGADVALLARGSEKLAADFATGDQSHRSSY